MTKDATKAVATKSKTLSNNGAAGKKKATRGAGRAKAIAKSSTKSPATTKAKASAPSSSITAKNNPSSNWKQLLNKINPEAVKVKIVKKIVAKKSTTTAITTTTTTSSSSSSQKTLGALTISQKRKHEEIDQTPDNLSAASTQSKKPKTIDLWFDDISKEDLEKAYGKSKKSEYDPTETAKHKIGKYIGIDCEMVGVGPEGIQSALARVSLVNFYGVTVLDLYVRPQERVTDFRTAVSGITPRHLATATLFKDAQKQVADIIQDKVLVGHAIQNDLQALLLDHPQRLIRDTSKYKPFRAYAKGKTPGLKKLASEILDIHIQQGQHSSVEDARVTMLLYRKHKDAWDASLAKNDRRRSAKATKNKKGAAE
ncbi:3'-5' exonuclease [Actinomortierella ambigua]|uniref:RNA exonuclease 4 n=1 Tax=Actinomortierella ambigua TaxID=1343610 RepID=A0A9P6QHN7_9FUNG|nr:3'-5' exonuclease [Actinomortierella ambigua]